MLNKNKTTVNKKRMTIRILTMALVLQMFSGFDVSASSNSKSSKDGEMGVQPNVMVDFNTESEYNNKITPKVNKKSDMVAIYKKANKKSDIVGYLPAGSIGKILVQYDDWTQVKSGDITGWVRTSKISDGYGMKEMTTEKEKLFNKVVKVKADVLRVREDASKQSEVVDMVTKGDELNLIDEKSDWVKTDLGFVSKDYVSTEIDFLSAISVDELNNSQTSNSNSDDGNNRNNLDFSDVPDNSDCSELRQEMVKWACTKLGCPYVYGGESFETGIDCSAYVRAIYAQFGMSLPRTSASQSVIAPGIDIEDIQPGDLLFYLNKSGRVGHVAMYIGDGKVINASTESTGVIIYDITYRTPYKIVNMIKHFGKE